MNVLRAMFVLSGLLLIGLSIPLIQRRVKPNWFYGFRTPGTVRNPELWYQVNEAGGRGLLICGVITVVSALALSFVQGITEDSYALICTVIICGALMASIGSIWWRYLR